MNPGYSLNTVCSLCVYWFLVRTWNEWLVCIPEGVWWKERLIELIGRQHERSSCLVPVPMKDGIETLPDRLRPVLISHWHYTYTCALTPKAGKRGENPSQSPRGWTTLYRGNDCFPFASGWSSTTERYPKISILRVCILSSKYFRFSFFLILNLNFCYKILCFYIFGIFNQKTWFSECCWFPLILLLSWREREPYHNSHLLVIHFLP